MPKKNKVVDFIHRQNAYAVPSCKVRQEYCAYIDDSVEECRNEEHKDSLVLKNNFNVL